MVKGPLIWPITIVTILIGPLVSTHEPPSRWLVCRSVFGKTRRGISCRQQQSTKAARCFFSCLFGHSAYMQRNELSFHSMIVVALTFVAMISRP